MLLNGKYFIESESEIVRKIVFLLLKLKMKKEGAWKSAYVFVKGEHDTAKKMLKRFKQYFAWKDEASQAIFKMMLVGVI